MSFTHLLHRLSPGITLEIERSGTASTIRLARELLKAQKNIVIVAKSMSELTEYKSLLTLFTPDISCSAPELSTTPWGRDVIIMPQAPTAISSKTTWAERMAALYALANRKKTQGVLVTLDNFLFKLPPKTLFSDYELRLYKGMEMAPELVLDQAIDWGYVRSPMVSIPGEVAMRGDILDIFCPGYTHPLRMEFFGDSLDDIRLFNPSSQRSLADCEEIFVLPVTPIITSHEMLEKAQSFWQEEKLAGRLSTEEITTLLHTAESSPNKLLPGVYYKDASCLQDWLPDDSVYIFPDKAECFAELLSLERTAETFFQTQATTEHIHQPTSMVLQPCNEIQEVFEKSTTISFNSVRIGIEEAEQHTVLPEHSLDTFTAIFPQPEAMERPWQYFVNIAKAWSTAASRMGNHQRISVSSESLLGQHLHLWFGAGDAALGDEAIAGCSKLILSFSSERSRERFLKLTEQDGIFPKLRYDEEENGIFALISPFRQGKAIAWDHTLILGEDVLQPRAAKAHHTPQKSFKGLDRYDALEDGDFLVHRDYGVGMFGGLHRMTLGSVESDYLLLLYADDDKLYLPVDRLSLIQRYKGLDNEIPSRDKLGGTLWSSSRDKAKKAIEKIAADLVEMYALRKIVKGFRYDPIDDMYREFEATFGFEETPDQAKVIEEVMADMEKPEPMDRLVCGDVGFGKTEVALRAAVRAAFNGRQVAMLCPTTILAEQHYQTFRTRLAGFPVNVGLLSRFVSKGKQKEVLESCANGNIDILIGTHRILSKDIVLPKLGLLILDEEQRFGVRHKERMKEMRQNIDALTLTATPIPRTLQLSLSGVRELSVIETAPPERKPVATALIERDEITLKEIVTRELERKGQIFWVYNRVQGLERVVEYVKKIVPDARIGMAHGQMGERELENTMRSFWVGDIDILVCTSIVESGLDFPNANTLIVDQAQLFGLGQLYQLRGRVGRSDKQAFAVFVVSDVDRLSSVAKQRMKVLLEMDHLGAGFQVAMEDLRMRGAGNILGESQSGHMNRIGLELFLEMLEEAVTKLKGQPIRQMVETELNLGVPAFIPESYMNDARERLAFYKKLSSAMDENSQQDIELEARDRFGAFPVELENFAAIIRFKRVLSNWLATKADILMHKIRIHFSESSPLDTEKIVATLTTPQEPDFTLKLSPPTTIELSLPDKPLKTCLERAESILYSLMLHDKEKV